MTSHNEDYIENFPIHYMYVASIIYGYTIIALITPHIYVQNS